MLMCIMLMNDHALPQKQTFEGYLHVSEMELPQSANTSHPHNLTSLRTFMNIIMAGTWSSHLIGLQNFIS